MAEPIGVGSAIFNESRNWIMPRVRSNCHQPQSATCFGGFRANILSKINLISSICTKYLLQCCLDLRKAAGQMCLLFFAEFLRPVIVDLNPDIKVVQITF